MPLNKETKPNFILTSEVNIVCEKFQCFVEKYSFKFK